MAKKILVIDDEKDITLALKTCFESCGYKVITAHDGDTGLEILKLTKPDLVILDVMMPRMDGFSFVKKMKKDKAIPDIPIIVVTAKEKTRDLFEIEGVKDYIVKPCDLDELLGKVRKCLQLKAEQGG